MADEETMDLEEEAPRPRMSKMGWLIIGFSVALGVLFLALVGGGLYFAKKTSGLQSELTASRKEIKELKVRMLAAEEMPAPLAARLAALALEVEALKEQASAHPVPEVPVAAPVPAPAEAGKVGGKTAGKPVANAPVKGERSAPAKDSKEAPAAQKPAPAVEPVAPALAPKAKKPASDAFSCDLGGKSPEEQAVILKRCVSVMDTLPPPLKSKPAPR